MMGIKGRAFGPLPPVTLEELVPPDHFYRHLEATLDLGFVRDVVRDAYAGKGRPSIDPVVFFKLQLVMFFEVDHPRVVATVKRIIDELTIDGFVHRYTLATDELPLGEFEGAFLPCTFWLATVLAMAGQTGQARTILAAAEAIAGE